MKKTLFKKTNKMYRITLLLIVFVMLVSSIPASAVNVSTGNLKRIKLSSGETVTLTKQQLDDIIVITADEARSVAESFVSDMIRLGNVCWNENTELVNIVPMYDTENVVSAYTINLTTGYVVVSAFLDAESIIPEWSDESLPIFMNSNFSVDDKVVYLGLNEYYIQKNNDTLITVLGDKAEQSKLVNYFESGRDLSNIPDYIFRKDVASTRDISDPVTDTINYPGPFTDLGETDLWSNYVEHYASINITGENGVNNPNGYRGFCVPMAITNLLIAYREKYNYNILPDNLTIFNKVCEIGINSGYYNPYGTTPGTVPIVIDSYLQAVFNYYSITATIHEYTAGNGGLVDFDTLYWIMAEDEAVFLTSLVEHSIYGNHTVMCYGYRRFRSVTTGAYLTYLKIADGIARGARYITYASAINKYSVVANI